MASWLSLCLLFLRLLSFQREERKEPPNDLPHFLRVFVLVDGGHFAPIKCDLLIYFIVPQGRLLTQAGWANSLNTRPWQVVLPILPPTSPTRPTPFSPALPSNKAHQVLSVHLSTTKGRRNEAERENINRGSALSTSSAWQW